MRLAAIVQMLRPHPRPLSKPAVHHHHPEPVMYDSDSQPGYLAYDSKHHPLQSKGSIPLLHEQSHISDVVEKCRK